MYYFQGAGGANLWYLVARFSLLRSYSTLMYLPNDQSIEYRPRVHQPPWIQTSLDCSHHFDRRATEFHVDKILLPKSDTVLSL